MFVSLDLQSVIDDEARKQALELRVWITGMDMAGQPISPEFNAKDAPFGIWQLEQQIPELEFLNPDI